MTEAQEQIFSKVEELLREHFEAAVVVVQATTEDDKADFTKATYHGGYATGIGLLEVAKMEIWDKRQTRPQEEE